MPTLQHLGKWDNPPLHEGIAARLPHPDLARSCAAALTLFFLF
jgi:hypothetical protein